MSRLLVLAPEPVRARMAGMGIRAAEIARHLSLADHPVTLLTPGDPDQAPESLGAAGVRVMPMERLSEQLERHDAAIVSGHVSNALFAEASRLPTLVDLYDPFLIENLAYVDRLGWDPYRNDHRTLRQQLQLGDRFLVSSEAQRLFYAGFLLALGRLNPDSFAADPTLARWLAIVPFGVPDQPPAPGAPLLRGVVPGIGAQDPILFFGGIYDWYEPEAVVGALPHLLAAVPDLRLVFVESPNPETTPQGAFARAKARADGEGLTGRHVFFVPWFPYERRGSVYSEATVAVLTHKPGLETELSLRTRGLDFLWGGLPIVAERGGAMGRILADHHAGLLVDPGDTAGLAGALVRLLTDADLRATLSRRGREVAALHRWSEVLKPVLEFARAPELDPAKAKFQPEAISVALGGGQSLLPGGGSTPLSHRLTSRLERLFTNTKE